jgi:hypothetical protein
MDLAFFRRAEQLLAPRVAAPLDYGMLLAMLRAERAGWAPPAPDAREDGQADREHPLVELLLGGPGWRDAAAALGGSFNPARARCAAEIGRQSK